MKQAIGGLFLVALFAAAALRAQETVDRATVDRIRTEGLERSKVLETFNYITNVTGARLTGSPAHKQAAEYMRARFNDWGLTNARLEPFQFGRGWELKKFSLELVAPRYFPMYGFPEAWTTSTTGVVEGVPIYLGDKTPTQIDALGEKLRGAIILGQPEQTVFVSADRPQPTDPNPGTDRAPPPGRQTYSLTAAQPLQILLRKYGAAVYLRPSNGQHGTIFVGGYETTPADAVPSLTVVAEHYNMVLRMLNAGAAPRLRVEIRTTFHETDTNSYNVIAEIPGEDPALRDELVIVGAHLDSLHSATGASDNADGAAAAAEAMRILKAVGARPRRTIRVVLWSGEELGIMGGRAYREQHLPDATSRDKVSVYLNSDPGTGQPYGWFMANNAAAKTIFDTWLEPLKDLGLRRNVMTNSFSSEDGIFNGAGIPSFTTIQDYTNYDRRLHHTNADFYEAVSEPDLQRSAIVFAVFAYEAAMRDEKIPRRPAGTLPTPR